MGMEGAGPSPAGDTGHWPEPDGHWPEPDGHWTLAGAAGRGVVLELGSPGRALRSAGVTPELETVAIFGSWDPMEARTAESWIFDF